MKFKTRWLQNEFDPSESLSNLHSFPVYWLEWSTNNQRNNHPTASTIIFSLMLCSHKAGSCRWRCMMHIFCVMHTEIFEVCYVCHVELSRFCRVLFNLFYNMALQKNAIQTNCMLFLLLSPLPCLILSNYVKTKNSSFQPKAVKVHTV